MSCMSFSISFNSLLLDWLGHRLQGSYAVLNVMLGKQLLEPCYLTILGGTLLFECLSRLLIAAQHFLHALHHLGKAGYLITGPL